MSYGYNFIFWKQVILIGLGFDSILVDYHMVVFKGKDSGRTKVFLLVLEKIIREIVISRFDIKYMLLISLGYSSLVTTGQQPSTKHLFSNCQ